MGHDGVTGEVAGVRPAWRLSRSMRALLEAGAWPNRVSIPVGGSQLYRWRAASPEVPTIAPISTH